MSLEEDAEVNQLVSRARSVISARTSGLASWCQIYGSTRFAGNQLDLNRYYGYACRIRWY